MDQRSAFHQTVMGQEFIDDRPVFGNAEEPALVVTGARADPFLFDAAFGAVEVVDHKRRNERVVSAVDKESRDLRVQFPDGVQRIGVVITDLPYRCILIGKTVERFERHEREVALLEIFGQVSYWCSRSPQ